MTVILSNNIKAERPHSGGNLQGTWGSEGPFPPTAVKVLVRGQQVRQGAGGTLPLEGNYATSLQLYDHTAGQGQGLL